MDKVTKGVILERGESRLSATSVGAFRVWREREDSAKGAEKEHRARTEKNQ